MNLKHNIWIGMFETIFMFTKQTENDSKVPSPHMKFPLWKSIDLYAATQYWIFDHIILCVLQIQKLYFQKKKHEFIEQEKWFSDILQ